MTSYIKLLEKEIAILKNTEEFNKRTTDILEMIAIGRPASEVYDAIALLYESRHPGLRCSMLELEDGKLLHGGAPSLPKEYCEAVHGLENGPNVGSCGTSTYTGKRCIVENIETDPKWANIKHVALPHGMRCCWSEPIKDSYDNVLGAFGMYYNHPARPNRQESKDLISAARLAGLVMERDHNQKRIHELAYTDTLTKLASRAYFYQHMDNLIRSSNRHNRKFSMLFLDLDNFKRVNDSLGHDAGDKLLKEISCRLKIACRESDFIARLSGDEFCVVTEDAENECFNGNLAQRCIDVVSQPVILGNHTHIPTCSIGIAHYPDDGNEISVLLKAADTALYSAKDMGKNRYAFYKPELTKKAEYQFYFEQSLRCALEKKQFSLVYQPQVDIATKKVVGVEALTRWNHPDFSQISPVEFFEVAERIGIIKQLTDWVLLTACTQAAAWEKSGIEPLKVSVNISPRHFLDEDIVSSIIGVLDQTGIRPSLLELEVIENVVQTDPKNLSIFKQLKSLGICLAIDDFGTGYSSFASLKHISIDCLKIDKYFIHDMMNDQNSKFLISSMIDIGQNLGHKIIAEGVETKEQLTVLKELGCETVQGFLFSKPLDANTLQKKLRCGL